MPDKRRQKEDREYKQSPISERGDAGDGAAGKVEEEKEDIELKTHIEALDRKLDQLN